jgi:LysM repeat protein
LAQYKVRFEAPASNVVLFIRGWKKFAITNVEMDLNLDAISVRACDSMGSDKPQGDWQKDGWQEPQYPGQGGPVNQGQDHASNQNSDTNRNNERGNYDQGANCLYVVKPGDTLSQIAAEHGVSMSDIIRANGIDDPSAIYVGQKFEIPGCMVDERSSKPEKSASYEQERPSQGYEITQGERPTEMPVRTGPALRPEVDRRYEVEQTPERGPQQGPDRQANRRTYTVQGGDMLGWIAEEVGVDAYELAVYNGIDNMNFIYAGQVLLIPN